MFGWAIIFAIVTLVASFLGMNNIAGLSKELAYIFLVIAAIFFVIGIFSRKKS